MKGIYWLGLGIASFQAFMINPCVAQSSNIIPDNSLGGESSQINENPQQLPPGFSREKIETITGGAQKGINLFHSFQEFNVSEGRGAYFFSPNAEVQNILTRVTGRNPSEILGTLGTFGNSQPNLYLINPNGIVFGENASLDVGGSFVATTANGINLGETGLFSATEPNSSNLLSVNPSALFFNAVNSQAGIVNRSKATSTVLGSALNGDANRPINGLQVLDGKSLLLVGGDVSLNGGKLVAPGGRVELGGLGEAGKVGLGVDGDIFSLNFPDAVQRGDISLTNESGISTLGGGGGSIAVNAKNMNVSGGSLIFAGIGEGLGTVDSQAGDITFNATGKVTIADTGSGVGNIVRLDSQGNGGNITVEAGSFNLAQGAVLSASTSGNGNAGNVTVTAKDAISLTGNTYIFSTVETGGVGKGGNIDMNAATFTLRDGAQLVTVTRGASNSQPPGKGDAGNINLKVSGAVDIAGKKDAFRSGLRSDMRTGTEGNGGNITVDAGSFNLAQGARLSTSTFGNGNAGNVTVTAKDAISLTDSDILSTVEAGGVGKGGDIDMNAATLTLRDGAQLLTTTRDASENQPPGKGDAGNINLKVSDVVDIAVKRDMFFSGLASDVETGAEGNGGNITVDAGSFNLAQGAQLSASTFGNGNAGNVTVTAKDAISLTGNTYIFSTVETGGVGKGGNIDMNAATFTLRDGAQLVTVTRGASNSQPPGKGDAGNINLKVSGAVDIAGKKDAFRSGLRSDMRTGTEGNGGNITVDAGSFNLAQGAQLIASTSGKGNAGNVTIAAKDAVFLTDANIFSAMEAGGVGKGGDIDINAATLTLRDGAQLVTATRGASDTQPAGKGDAGNINLKVSGAVDIAGKRDMFFSGLRSDVGTGTEGNGGNITVDAGSFNLARGAQLAASTSGNGNAGNVTITIKDAAFLTDANIFSTVEAGGVGKGGNIDINAATFTLRDGTQLVTVTRGASDNQPPGKGDAGNINLKVSYAADIASKSGLFTAVQTGTEGNGGNITVDAGSFNLAQGAQLGASTFGNGNAGNVKVTTKDAISLTGDTYIFSTVEAGSMGKGGNIDINAATLTLRDGAQLLTITRAASESQPPGKGDAGNINLKVSGAVDIAGKRDAFPSGLASEVETGTEGNGGNITIDAGSFKLGEGAVVNASTSGNGNAGTIEVHAAEFFTVSNPNGNFSTGLFVDSQSTGSAEDIIVNSPKITLDNGTLNANSASGNGGNINVISDLLLLRRGAEISTNAGTAQQGGDGGNIKINSKFIVALPQENSDITANAFSGTGGNVNIPSQGIFGIEPRTQQTDKSDITASSELGVPGVINLTDPDDSNIRNNLDDLPENQIDTNALIANSCISRSTNRQENSFTITGPGGLRNSPGDGFISEYFTGDVRNVKPKSQVWKKGDVIVEPQGLYKLPDGRLLLSRSC